MALNTELGWSVTKWSIHDGFSGMDFDGSSTGCLKKIRKRILENGKVVFSIWKEVESFVNMLVS